MRCGEKKTERRSGGARVVRAGLGLGRVEKLPDHGSPFGDAGGEVANGTRQPELGAGHGLGRAGEALLRVGKVREGNRVEIRCGGSIFAGRARGVPGRAAGGGRGRGYAGGWPERRLESLNVADLAERRDIEMLLRQPGDPNRDAVEAARMGGGWRSSGNASGAWPATRGISSKRSVPATGLESRPAERMWSQSLAARKRR